MKMTREMYTPADAILMNVPDSDSEVYFYDSPLARPCAMGFAGKAVKPTFAHSFNSPEHRAKYIDIFLRDQKDRLAARAEAAAVRKAFQHTLKKGDILYTSWGYDQTNVDFFQVTEVAGKSVWVRELVGFIEPAGTSSERVTTIKDQFKSGAEAFRRVVGQGNSVRIHDSATGYPWDGKSKHQTAFGFGH